MTRNVFKFNECILRMSIRARPCKVYKEENHTFLQRNKTRRRHNQREFLVCSLDIRPRRYTLYDNDCVSLP